MDLGDYELDEADLIFLEMCDSCSAGELELLTHVEGREIEDASAMVKHADSMVRRGFYERVSVGGSKARHQGARFRCVYRRTEAGEALAAAIRRIRELEAQSRQSRSKAKRPAEVNDQSGSL
jgi:DNA-binding MarR family transcriptional regulator